MKEHQYVKWEKTRSKGRSRYIWITWVLAWGILTAVGWSLFGAWRDGWDKLPALLAIGLLGFPLGGYILGGWMWNRIEKEYREALAERRFIYCDREE